MSEGASKSVSTAVCASEASRVEQANKYAEHANKRVVQANGRASNPVHPSGFLIILAHSAMEGTIDRTPSCLLHLFLIFFQAAYLPASEVIPRNPFSQFSFACLHTRSFFRLFFRLYFVRRRHEVAVLCVPGPIVVY